jgi:hypothetical protein
MVRFGVAWEWAIKQEWWIVYRGRDDVDLELLINPDVFLNEIYEFLQIR